MTTRRRIIAVSSDEALSAQLVEALDGLGDVEYHRNFDTIDQPSGWFVVHVAGLLASAAHVFVQQRVPPDGRVLLILPGGSLAAIVEQMQVVEQVVGMVEGDPFEPSRLRELVSQLVNDSSFAPWQLGKTAQEAEIGDAYEKQVALHELDAALAGQGVSTGDRTTIEQCLDELVTNALFDAPVDKHGRRLFATIDPRDRLDLRTDKTVALAFAIEPRRVLVTVRDEFGSLDRAAVLRVLYKCVTVRQMVDRRAAGAGVGLYLVLNAATAVVFRVVPGATTEIMLVLELGEHPHGLRQLAFVAQGGAQARSAGKRIRAGRSIVPYVFVAVVMLIGLGIGLWPRIARHFRSPPPPATVDIDSTPSGAAVTIDGRAVGDTPVTLSTLLPDSDVTLELRHVGYQTASVHLHVPATGSSTRMRTPLQPSADFAHVHVTSSPPGARVVEVGDTGSDATRVYTPADLIVSVGHPHEFVVEMPGRVSTHLGPITPTPGAHIELSANLVAAPGK